MNFHQTRESMLVVLLKFLTLIWIGTQTEPRSYDSIQRNIDPIK